MRTNHWLNAAGGTWGDASNWSGGVPGIQDNVVLSSTIARTVTFSNPISSVASIQASNVTLRLTQGELVTKSAALGNLAIAGGTLLLTGNGSAQALSLSSGRLSVTRGGTFTSHAATFSGGTIYGPGGLITTGVSSILAGATITLAAATSWTNRGITTVSGNLLPASGTQIQVLNASGGQLIFSGNGSDLLRGVGAGSALVNDGVLGHSGAGTSHIAARISGDGTIDVSGGTLELDGGGTLEGGISGPGTLLLRQGLYTGSLQGDGTSSVVLGSNAHLIASQGNLDAFTLSGGLLQADKSSFATYVQASGTASLSGVDIGGRLSLKDGLLVFNGSASSMGGGMVQTGGSLALRVNVAISGTSSLSGELTATAGATLELKGTATLAGTISGPGKLTTEGLANVQTGQTLTLAEGVGWTNGGTMTLAGIMRAASGSQLQLLNLASGSVVLNTDAGGIYRNSRYGSALQNSGTITKTNSGTSVLNTTLSSTGILNVNSGTLQLDGGGTLGGTIEGHGMLRVDRGHYDITARSLGATLRVEAPGYVTSAATYYAGDLRVAGHFHSTAANVTVAGSLSVAAGRFLALAGASTLTTAGTTTLRDGVVLGGNAGAVRWTNEGQATISGSVSGGGAALAVVNTSSGTITLSDNSTVTASSLTNGGSIVLSGTGVAMLNATLINTGVLNLGSASLILGNGGQLGGKLLGTGTIGLAGGVLRVSGLTQIGVSVQIADGVLSTGVNFGHGLQVSGGSVTLNGAHQSIQGSLEITGGTVALAHATSVTGDLGVSGGGALVIGNGVTLSRSELVLQDGGTIAGGGTLVTSGTISVAGDGYNVLLGDGINWTNGGRLVVGGAVDTYGTADSHVTNEAHSTLEFASDGSGLLTGDAGSTLTNAGQVLADSGGFTQIDSAIYNSGTIAVSAAGYLDLTGTVQGSGTLALGAGATIEAASIGDGQVVSFGGEGATLVLDQGQGLTAKLHGFGAGDTIDFANVASATARIDHNTLRITSSDGPTFSFSASDSLAGLVASVSSDGLGGTFVTLETASHATSALTVAAGTPETRGSLAMLHETPTYDVWSHVVQMG